METKLEQIAATAVKQRPKSVVREIRTPRSVGTGGGRPPPVTRWAPSNGCPYRNREMTTFFLSLRVSGSFKIVRVPLEETDGRELRRPLLLPAAVCRAVSDSGSMRSSSDKGNMVSAGIGSATGCGWRRARGIRTPCYLGPDRWHHLSSRSLDSAPRSGPTPPLREAPNGERGGARSASEFRVPGPSATRPIWRRPSLPFSATFEISRRIGLGGPNGG